MKTSSCLFTSLLFLSSLTAGFPHGGGQRNQAAPPQIYQRGAGSLLHSTLTAAAGNPMHTGQTQGAGTGASKPVPTSPHGGTGKSQQPSATLSVNVGGPKHANSTSGTKVPLSTGTASGHKGSPTILPGLNSTKNGTDSNGGQPIWALNGATCNDINFERSGAKQWANVDGDKVMQNFTQTFNTNAAYCHECLGLPVSQCKQAQKGNPNYDDHCANGLSFESFGRWDQAAAHFANLAGSGDINCGISDSGCAGNPPCDLANGPGTYAIVKSLETLHNIASNVYDAMDIARGYCTTQMTQFSSDFAPPPPPAVPQWFALLNSFIGLAGGLVGSIEGYAVAGTLVAFSGSLSYGIMAESQQSQAPKDTDKIMGDIAENAMTSMQTVVNGLVKDGNFTYKSKAYDGSTDMTLEKMFTNGNYMVAPATDKDYKGMLADQYKKVLFQQTAVYTWSHLDSPKAIPYITFENGKCGNTNNALDDHIDNMNRDDSHVDLDGKCYYLLAATESSQPLFICGEPGAESHNCDGGGTLPGGTFDTLDGKAYSGLTVGDFVVPSVKTWEDNGKKNGGKPAWQTGKVITDIQQTGMVSIPVCDFVNSPGSPGDGCPKVGGMTDDNGGVCETFGGNNNNNKRSSLLAGDQKSANQAKRSWNHKRMESNRERYSERRRVQELHARC